MADERIAFENEPTGVADTWKTYAIRDTNSPKLWMDAWLAAFARCSGWQMVTTDKAFSQFVGPDLQILKAEDC